jgi:hypothetical protein
MEKKAEARLTKEPHAKFNKNLPSSRKTSRGKKKLIALWEAKEVPHQKPGSQESHGQSQKVLKGIPRRSIKH